MAEKFNCRINYILLLMLPLLAAGALLFSLFSTDIQKVKTEVDLHDFDNDGIFEEIISKKNLIEIRNSEYELLFVSDTKYEVNSFLIGDIDNDFDEELVIGYLRYGDFGKNLINSSFRRDPKKGYHIDIYTFSDKTNHFILEWGSSTLPHPIFSFNLIRDDQTNILEVVEGSYKDYDDFQTLRPKEKSYWIWTEWWFEEYAYRIEG